jgi:hypothetical protein
MVQEWNRLWQASRPVLQVQAECGRLRIHDTRPIALHQDWIAGETESQVFRLCDSAQTPAALLKQISTLRAAEVPINEIENAIQILCDAKVMLLMNGKLISLGINQTQKRSATATAGILDRPAVADVSSLHEV